MSGPFSVGGSERCDGDVSITGEGIALDVIGFAES